MSLLVLVLADVSMMVAAAGTSPANGDSEAATLQEATFDAAGYARTSANSSAAVRGVTFWATVEIFKCAYVWCCDPNVFAYWHSSQCRLPQELHHVRPTIWCFLCRCLSDL